MTHVSGWSEKCLFDWGVIFGWKRWKYASIRPGRSEEIVREPLAALRAVGGGVCGIICLLPSHRLLSPHPASIVCPLFSRAVLGTEDTAEKKEGKTQRTYYRLHIFWAPGGSCKWSWSPPPPPPCCSEEYLPNRAQKTQCGSGGIVWTLGVGRKRWSVQITNLWVSLQLPIICPERLIRECFLRRASKRFRRMPVSDCWHPWWPAKTETRWAATLWAVPTRRASWCCQEDCSGVSAHPRSWKSVFLMYSDLHLTTENILAPTVTAKWPFFMFIELMQI